MKRYRFVLVLLILMVSAAGCRRSGSLFGKRGARCSPQPQVVYAPPPPPPPVVAAPPRVVCYPTCPTPCDECPVVGKEIYGGEVIGDTTIPDSSVIEPYNGASLSPGQIPSLEGSTAFGDIAPSLPNPSAGLGQNVYGRPTFQVVGDRRLNPGESLQDFENDTTPPTQSDKTAPAPKK